ncbi:hypothetical protein CcCBS67573_g04932 [Chytriomyces confervae]|uniref:TLC domain-containing protein n=1 Tax=Chytriomyces confervae TaxID=246404 RepID=A0A507FBX3_9FUNG|nr:hypothetical protein CcCBS67573_g04932 [Chytriomyces confervae]
MNSSPPLLELVFRSCIFMAFYCIVHVIVDVLYARAATTKFRLSFSERISVAEKVCSSINAVYASASAFTIIFIRNAFTADAFNGANCASPMSALLSVYPKAPSDVGFISSLLDADWFLPAYIGYSIYDCVTMYFQGDNHWSMWVHHLVGIYGAIGNLHIRKLSVLSTFALGTEITALFVNLVWYAETLDLNRPQQILARRASITAAMGDEDDTPLVTPTMTPSNSETALDKVPLLSTPPAPSTTLSDSTTTPETSKKSASKRKMRAAKKAPATLTLVLVQFLRTLSFILFRITAVPYSFYLVGTLGRTEAFSFMTLVDMVAVVWNGFSTCPKSFLAWDMDRMFGVTALIVQVLFGALNVVWTLVAVKVAKRDLRRYIAGSRGSESAGKLKEE